MADDILQDHERRLPIQRARRQPSAHDLCDREVQEDCVRGQRAQARGAGQRRNQERAALLQEPSAQVALHSLDMNALRGKGRHGWLVYILRNDIRFVCSEHELVLTILVPTGNSRTSLDPPASDSSPPTIQSQGQTTPHRMEMPHEHVNPKTLIRDVQTNIKNSLFFAL